MKYITNQFNKLVPILERMLRWIVRTSFELIKLTGLAFTIMHLISAAIVVEAILAGVAVFASLYFTKYWK